MTLVLSAPPPFRKPDPRRQRVLLLLGSVAIHAAVLIPIALHTVVVPAFLDNNRTFEVWIDMARPEPRPQERPQPDIRPELRPVPDSRIEQVQEQPRPVDPPVIEERPQPERQQATVMQQQQLQELSAQTPQLAPQALPRPLYAESLDAPNPLSPVDALGPVPVVTIAPRPHIEAIDGPVGDSVRPLDANNAINNVQTEIARMANTEVVSAAPDVPMPRRARMTEEELAALAAAAASGALDDAWIYVPEGGAAGQAGQDGSAGGAGAGAAGGAAAAASGSGDIYFRGTPVDCTQPHMLSDIQKLSCDSAEARRIQSAIDRGVRVMGTGDAARDTRMSEDAAARARAYEARRAPARGGVGVVGVEDGPGSNFGMGAAGRHLDPSLRPDSTGPIQSRQRDGDEAARIKRTPN